jgi:hypothetical protein
MTPWNLNLGGMFGLIALAGLIGGIINIFVSENGFVLPGRKKIGDNTVFQPGFIGTLVAGAASAALSWGLEGPAKDVIIARVKQGTPPSVPAAEITLTVVALAGAVLIGFGGAKWLNAEVDKRLMKAGFAVFARTYVTDPALAARVAGASPSAIGDIAAQLG